jgi:hypothetical protein
MTVLLESTSPHGNASVVIEQDGRVVYMYLLLQVSGENSVRSCWVRNLTTAPAAFDAAGMRDGRAPMMPERHCAHPGGVPMPVPESLSVVWSEEGDGAALYEDGILLAVIPGWSGQNGFHGYARDCKGQGPIAWALGDREANVLFERYVRAAQYWAQWDDENFWPGYCDGLLSRIENVYGPHHRYFAIDGQQWPPKCLTVFQRDHKLAMITVGVSIRPQPRVELQMPDPEKYRRLKLGVCTDATLPEDHLKRIASYVSGQTSLPWSMNTWLGAGHTIPSDVFADLSGGRLPYALLSSTHPVVPPVQLPQFRGDEVNLLWMIPISENERRFAMEKSSAVLWDVLLAKSAHQLEHFTRAEVVSG